MIVLAQTSGERVKQDPLLRSTPVILLTALSDPTDVIKGLNAGAEAYITKPYHNDSLHSQIERLLRVPRDEPHPADVSDPLDVEVTSTVEEIAASSRITADQAEAVAIASKHAQETSDQGMQLAAKNQVEMTELEKRMSNIASQILVLSEQAAQIGSISRLVSCCRRRGKTHKACLII